MAFTTDTIIIGVIAVAAFVLLGLLFSLWRWAVSRRNLGRLRQYTQRCEQDLRQQAELTRHLEQDCHQKDITLGTQGAELANLHQRLQISSAATLKVAALALMFSPDPVWPPRASSPPKRRVSSWESRRW